MAKPKSGDLLTYTADVERTGVVLDRGPSPMVATYEEGLEKVWKPADFRVWVHREDGTFDLVRVHTRGARKGQAEWCNRVTAGGRPLRAGESFPKSA